VHPYAFITCTTTLAELLGVFFKEKAVHQGTFPLKSILLQWNMAVISKLFIVLTIFFQKTITF